MVPVSVAKYGEAFCAPFVRVAPTKRKSRRTRCSCHANEKETRRLTERDSNGPISYETSPPFKKLVDHNVLNPGNASLQFLLSSFLLIPLRASLNFFSSTRNDTAELRPHYCSTPEGTTLFIIATFSKDSLMASRLADNTPAAFSCRWNFSLPHKHREERQSGRISE